MADGATCVTDGLRDIRQDEMQSFSILTMRAHELMKPIHDHMPVIIVPAEYDRWLNPCMTNSDIPSSSSLSRLS